ncbi:butyrophilin subfamily 1 member A1-like [Mauremys mutica]|uniref:butyrophilin subfamily 1 member A1-like n=1 Tax=Mauremys mutica TaxID=74926 RepID=UPI001D16F77C|nr:butyrophilin subfamily 1 member A1-like [Mauremys mutica]
MSSFKYLPNMTTTASFEYSPNMTTTAPLPHPTIINSNVNDWIYIPILILVGLTFIIAATILLKKCRRGHCGSCWGSRDPERTPLLEENDNLQTAQDWRRTCIYTDNVTFDKRTAHPNLSISWDEKSVNHESQPQRLLQNPERFDLTVCVLGSEGFSSGKHYWEVDVGTSTDWDLGVARKSIQRKGKLSFSTAEGFWVMGLCGSNYWAKTHPWTQIMVQEKTEKIGVYLSFPERQVTFFNVTDRTPLFTFNDCSFSGEVYPFFKNSDKETRMRICS